jgi:SAM-dependent methyltransferase
MKTLFVAKDYRRPGLPETWEVVWCDPCHYGKVAAELSPEEVSHFYPTDYYTHKSGDQSVDCPSILDRIRIYIAYRFDCGTELSPSELSVTGNLCDIGCGNGSNLKRFKDAGFQVVGVEPDIEARRLASEVAPVYAGTCESLPASLQREQDYVLLSHVLEHTISPAKALTNAHDLLKSNGVLIVEVPNNDAIGFRMFQQFWPWTDVPRHIHFFTEASLRRTIEAAGFRISSIRYVGYTRQFSNEWIADQQKIWAQLRDETGVFPNFSLLAWLLLARTLFRSKSHKYDSLRVHAVKI